MGANGRKTCYRLVKRMVFFSSKLSPSPFLVDKTSVLHTGPSTIFLCFIPVQGPPRYRLVILDKLAAWSNRCIEDRSTPPQSLLTCSTHPNALILMLAPLAAQDLVQVFLGPLAAPCILESEKVGIAKCAHDPKRYRSCSAASSLSHTSPTALRTCWAAQRHHQSYCHSHSHSHCHVRPK